MNKLLKLFTGMFLVLFAIVFQLFALQNNTTVEVSIFPEMQINVKLYVLVLTCFALGFISALVCTRFEHIKNRINVFRLVKKLKSFKKKSKYIVEE